MKDNSIRKMSRAELLELLIQCTEEKEALQKQLDQVKSELTQARKRLGEYEAASEHADQNQAAAAQLGSRLEDVHLLAMQCLEEIRAMKQCTFSGQTGTEAEQTEDGCEAQTRRRRRGTGL